MGPCFIGATQQLWQGVVWVCGYCGSELGRWCSGGFSAGRMVVMKAILGLNEVLVYGLVIWGYNL